MLNKAWARLIGPHVSFSPLMATDRRTKKFQKYFSAYWNRSVANRIIKRSYNIKGAIEMLSRLVVLSIHKVRESLLRLRYCMSFAKISNQSWSNHEKFK